MNLNRGTLSRGHGVDPLLSLLQCPVDNGPLAGPVPTVIQSSLLQCPVDNGPLAGPVPTVIQSARARGFDSVGLLLATTVGGFQLDFTVSGPFELALVRACFGKLFLLW